jgi:hypothetical protein
MASYIRSEVEGYVVYTIIRVPNAREVSAVEQVGGDGDKREICRLGALRVNRWYLIYWPYDITHPEAQHNMFFFGVVGKMNFYRANAGAPGHK